MSLRRKQIKRLQDQGMGVTLSGCQLRGSANTLKKLGPLVSANTPELYLKRLGSVRGTETARCFQGPRTNTRCHQELFGKQQPRRYHAAQQIKRAYSLKAYFACPPTPCPRGPQCRF